MLSRSYLLSFFVDSAMLHKGATLQSGGLDSTPVGGV